jgi:hypothetical protein
MTQIAISDEAASSLASAASNRGCNQDELASMLIEEGLRREEEFEPNPTQQARLLESYAQAERGNLIDGEVVMSKLERALSQIKSR